MSDRCSPASEVSTTASPEPDGTTRSSASPTSGGVPCSPGIGPESPSTTTYGKYQPLKKLTPEQVVEAIRLYQAGLSLARVAEPFGVTRQAMHDLLKRRIKLRGRVEALPRKPTSAIRAKRAEALKRYRSRAARITREQIRAVWGRDQVCQICSAEGEQIDHIIPVALGGQTKMENLQLLCRLCHITKSREERSTSLSVGSRVRICQSPDNDEGSPENDPASSLSSPASSTLFDPDGFSSRTFPDCSVVMAVGTSESCLERWPTSGTAWHGGFSTHVSSECRSDDAGCSSSEPSLSEILEPPQNVPARYSLSARAARGILRRAEKRGRTLPSHLSAALEAVAQTTTTDKQAE